MNEDNNEKPKYTYEELKKKYIDHEREEKKYNKELKGIGKAYFAITNFLITLILSIGLAITLGRYLDKLLGTKVLFLLLFLILGILASFRNLIVYTK